MLAWGRLDFSLERLRLLPFGVLEASAIERAAFVACLLLGGKLCRDCRHALRGMPKLRSQSVSYMFFFIIRLADALFVPFRSIMEHINSLNDMPPDVLCHILHCCCDGNVYKLDLLRPVSRCFRTSVAMVCTCPCLFRDGVTQGLIMIIERCAVVLIPCNRRHEEDFCTWTRQFYTGYYRHD